MPEWAVLAGLLDLYVSPLKTFLKPSVLRSIVLRVAESIFLSELLPDVTIISMVDGKRK